MTRNLGPQKFKDALTGDPQKDTEMALEVTKEFAGIQLDPEVVESYLKFALATKSYSPADKFDGNVVLVQALDRTLYFFFVPDEDYNISQVISRTGHLKINDRKYLVQVY